MSALLKVQSRRLARFGEAIRGATGMDLGGAHACPLPHPPHPPTMENRPRRGQTGRSRGRSIGFFYWGGWRVCEKPGEIAVTLAASTVAVRTPHPRVAIENPRVVPFSTRVRSFYPRVCFYVFPPTPLSISLFSLRKESEREGEQGKTSIHGFYLCNKMSPRVCFSIHGFSGDEKRGRAQCWRGFAGCFTPIHASTGRNAYTPQEGGSQ